MRSIFCLTFYTGSWIRSIYIYIYPHIIYIFLYYIVLYYIILYYIVLYTYYVIYYILYIIYYILYIIYYILYIIYYILYIIYYIHTYDLYEPSKVFLQNKPDATSQTPGDNLGHFVLGIACNIQGVVLDIQLV